MWMSLFSLCRLYFGSGSLFSFRSHSNFLLRAGQRIWKSSFTEFALKFWFAPTPEGFSFSSESSILVEVWPGSSDAGAVSPIFALVSPSIHAHKLAWDIAHVCSDYLRFICDRKVTTPNYFKNIQKHSLCFLLSLILDNSNIQLSTCGQAVAKSFSSSKFICLWLKRIFSKKIECGWMATWWLFLTKKTMTSTRTSTENLV